MVKLTGFERDSPTFSRSHALRWTKYAEFLVPTLCMGTHQDFSKGVLKQKTAGLGRLSVFHHGNRFLQNIQGMLKLVLFYSQGR